MKTLFTLLFVAVHALSFGQSCPGNSFMSQASIDNFIIENPTCTVIDGNVIIGSLDADPITNFNGFANITQITGYLNIVILEGTSIPMDFTGFSNLTSVQNISIDDNVDFPRVVNMDGFENVTTLGGIGFNNCRLLENMDAFNNITELGSFGMNGLFESLSSEILPNLISLGFLTFGNFIAPEFSGLNNVISIDQIYIDYYGPVNYGDLPYAETVFDCLHNLETISQSFEIYNQQTPLYFLGFENLVSCPNFLWEIGNCGGSCNYPDFDSLTNCDNLHLNINGIVAPTFPSLTYAQSIGFFGSTDINLIGLQEVGDLNIYNFTSTLSLPQLQIVNNNLTLDGLYISDIDAPNLVTVSGELTIAFCPNLSLCNEEFICNKIALEPELVDIHDNGIGCSTLVDIASNCGDLYIQGNVFVDADCDGSFSTGDITVSNPIILTDTNNPIGGSTYLGEYLFVPQQNTTYTFSPAQIPGTIASTPTTITTGPDNTPFPNNNFALCPDLQYHDIAVTASSWSMSPGFESEIFFHIENLSYNPEIVSLNAVILLLDNLIINSSTHPYSTNFDTITFEDFTIAPGETTTITLNVTLDTTIGNGSLNSINANVSSASTEVSLANNQDSFQNYVVASYDPNDISVDREAIDFTQVDQDGEWLVYQIRFQNTGTAPAQFINVVNEQDLDLDMSTIDMIAASHSYELIFNGREITWFFDNIQLPDSTTDLLGSQGYILFRIKTNPGITLDEVIESTAAIYFDYNEPVITNTATTVFYVCPESISAVGTTTYCEGETVILSANTGYDGYNWILDGSIIGTEQTFSADWSAGIYAIEYSGSTAYCISSSVIEIIVNDNPETPSITQNGNTLTASGSGTFTWLYNDQLLNDTDNSIEISASGDYSVSVTANGCTSATTLGNYTYLGINENDLVKMSAFPNPFTDIISLQLPAQTEKITVTDVSGKIVFEKNNIATSSIQLDLSFLEVGSYFITVNSASGAVSEVIVKM